MYIFGYGSLMYPSGINGRGMDYNYKWKDLCEAVLSDYKRGMFAHYVNNYYGIMKSKGDLVNGVVFEVHTDDDFGRLLINEGASEIYRNTKTGLMYEVVDVSDKMTPSFYKKVFAFVNTKDKSGCGKVTKSYVRSVYKNIQPWGYNFVDVFLRTGGMKPSSPLSGILPLYGMVRWAKHAFLTLGGRYG